MSNNLDLWKSVEKTNPNYTKKAKVSGNSITSISPQFQIMNATEKFGIYGESWGFKSIELDYSLVNVDFYMDKTEGVYPNIKITGKEKTTMGLVVFKAIFYHPKGEFPVINSIDLFTSNKRNKVDDNFAKKLETDSLTKCLSKLGFNADIFLGKFDDLRYLDDVKKEFSDNKQLNAPEPTKHKSKPEMTGKQAKEHAKNRVTLVEIKQTYNVTAEQESKYLKLLNKK